MLNQVLYIFKKLFSVLCDSLSSKYIFLGGFAIGIGIGIAVNTPLGPLTVAHGQSK